MPKVHLENNIDLRQESAPINCPAVHKQTHGKHRVYAMLQNHPFVLRFFIIILQSCPVY